jgi:N-acyl-L-homoserine lactone synthetase
MALVIRCHHRLVFADLLEQMFRLRHRVFVDRLGWKLNTDGLLEIDQFDHGRCLHLVVLDDEGRVRATSRLTPSLEPNVTCDVLQAQMGASFPRAAHIVEVSRHCVDPDLDEETRRETLLDIRIAQAELSNREGWTHKLGVSTNRLIQPWIRSGLKVDILGSPFMFPGESEFSFGWMVSRNEERPNAILEMLGADRGRLQDPDVDPGLLVRYGKALRRGA